MGYQSGIDVGAYQRRKGLVAGVCMLFVFFCLCPYLRILPLHLDAQPNALIFSVIIIALLGKHTLTKECAWLLFVLIAATAIMILSNPNALGLLILTNYISLFCISYAAYLALKRLNGIPYRLFTAIVCLWFVVGLIQTVISPSFLGFLTLRGSMSSASNGRGVTSLAVEPTFYGMISILMMIINYLNFRQYKHYKPLFLCLLAQLIMSKSTTCIMALAIAFSLYSLYCIVTRKNGIVYLALLIITGIAIYHAAHFYAYNNNTRLARVVQVLLESPGSFLFMDFSINNRFMHAFFPIKGFFDNFGLPHGLGHFNTYLLQQQKSPEWGYLLQYHVSQEYKINTSIGGGIFELGFFGLPIYYVIIHCLKKIKRKYNIKVAFCGFVLFCMMLNSMNFNQAILPFLIGNLIYLKYRHMSISS